jgi:hypothetical protein
MASFGVSVFSALSAFQCSRSSEQPLNITREPMSQNEAIICHKNTLYKDRHKIVTIYKLL